MFDIGHTLKDAGEVTSSGYGTVDAAAKVVDLGEGLVRGNVIVDVTAMAMADNDESYTLVLLGGNDASFTQEVPLAVFDLGVREVREGNRDAKLGRYVMPFQNEQNGAIFPFVRIRHVIGGTTPSINYVSRLEKDLPLTGKLYGTVATTTTTI